MKIHEIYLNFNLKFHQFQFKKFKRKMLQEQKKQKIDPNTLRRKTFIVEKFINFLIIVRMYAT